MHGLYWNRQGGYNGTDINETRLKIQMFHGSNNRKQDAITEPAANYECDVQDDPTCLTEHKTC
jgi:hypothetical protein